MKLPPSTTEKDIFKAKLSGHPIQFKIEVNDTILGNDFCLLLRKGIFFDRTGQFYRFVCKYPVDIWYHDKGVLVEIDTLDPEDVYLWPR